MKLKRTYSLLLALLLAIGVHAQQAWQEIKQNPYLSGSNYLAYRGPLKQLTPAPEGYTPCYISHYGRHGSRYLINERDYTRPLQILQRADSLGKLTPLGKDVLRRVRLINDESRKRLGELTQLGAEQHRQIGTRMYERFPEVFAGDAAVDAKSTVVIRCILSMENELQALLIKNPRLRISHDASEHDMYYMNLHDPELNKLKHTDATQQALDAFNSRHDAGQRVCEQLFADTAYLHHNVNQRLGYWLFKLASNLQSTELRKQFTLYDLFTSEELYQFWLSSNAWWYTAYGACPLNGATQPYSQRNLLGNIIAQADSCLQLPVPGATLRFGHETMVLPLTCLLGLNGYDQQIDDLEQLEAKGWINYKVFPMAANVQFIFYRRSGSDADVLVKVLLNEDEATLPLPSATGPYYRWSDVKAYYLEKLSRYGE